MSTSNSQIIQRRFLLILLAILLIVFFKMIAELLLGVILAGVLWAMTRGIYEWFLKKTKGRKQLSSGLSLFTIILLIIVPLILLAGAMAADAVNFTDEVQNWFEPNRPKLEKFLHEISLSGQIHIFNYDLAVEDITQKLQDAMGSVAQFLVSMLKKTAGGVAGALAMLFITLYTLYYCYLDGEKFLKWLKRLLPLSDEQSDKLFREFFSTSRATIKSVAILGAIQGALGGLAFWVCDIPAPFMWSVLIAIASVIPAVGTQIILFPAGIILIATGNVGYGIGLLLWSWVVVSTIDNLLRPILVGKDTNLSELMVFLSTIGGLTYFGFFGFLLGPVIASLLLACLNIYEDMMVEK